MQECSCGKRTLNDYSCPVVESYMLSDRIAWLTVECPEIANSARPGESVMVFPSDGNDPLLGRPFGVANTDTQKGHISVLYMLCGRGTELMTSIKAGDTVKVRGLLGVPLPMRNDKVHLTSGGVGIAIFLLYAKMFKERVAGVYFGLPGRGCEKVAQKIQSILPDVRIFTDDGSFGEGDSMFKVLPKTLLNEEIWACGPDGFLEAHKRHCEGYHDKLYFALDARMACGYGGCMGCVIETTSGLKRLCADQALFRSDEVI